MYFANKETYATLKNSSNLTPEPQKNLFVQRVWYEKKNYVEISDFFVKLIYSCISQKFHEVSRNFCEI